MSSPEIFFCAGPSIPSRTARDPILRGERSQQAMVSRPSQAQEKRLTLRDETAYLLTSSVAAMTGPALLLASSRLALWSVRMPS